MIDCELYLSKAWCDDSERRNSAHIPPNVNFKTKPKLAQDMLERAYSAGIHPDWVLGDSIYGSAEFRNFLVKHQQKYVMGITGQQRLWVNFEQVRIDRIVKEMPESAWKRYSVGQGSKGERIYDWVSWPVGIKDDHGFQRHALSRRGISDPEEYAYYFCYAPKIHQLRHWR